MPFLKVAAKQAHITLPEPGEYACGLIFMPRNATQRRRIEEVFARVVASEGQIYLGGRTVPTDNSMLGETARASEPFMRQVFIQRGPDTPDAEAFERKLYVIRKRAYTEIRVSTIGGAEYWYVASLSHKTLVYKGMLLTMQLDQYFPDLRNPADRDGDRSRALTVFDQHLSKLGSCAPVSLHRAQRRDQHAARQHQL